MLIFSFIIWLPLGCLVHRHDVKQRKVNANYGMRQVRLVRFSSRRCDWHEPGRPLTRQSSTMTFRPKSSQDFGAREFSIYLYLCRFLFHSTTRWCLRMSCLCVALFHACQVALALATEPSLPCLFELLVLVGLLVICLLFPLFAWRSFPSALFIVGNVQSVLWHCPAFAFLVCFCSVAVWLTALLVSRTPREPTLPRLLVLRQYRFCFVESEQTT